MGASRSPPPPRTTYDRYQTALVRIASGKCQDPAKVAYEALQIRRSPLDTLVGEVFGRLTVKSLVGLELNRYGNRKQRVWLCECACGGTKQTTTKNLRAGRTRSCGCLYFKKNKITKELLQRPQPKETQNVQL